MERIVDIGTEGLHLSAHRGFLIASKDRDEVGRIALDDVHAVILHAHGCSWTGNLAAALAERGSPIVFCNTHHSPVAVTLPITGFHAQGGRMRAQWEAGKPLAKQLWQRIVKAKVAMQGALLAFHGAREAAAFEMIARRVRSGDPDNLEAQAARRYWPALMGADFRRDRHAAGANALLNYGYAVMRATVARAVVAAGLHPTIGIFHANRGNAFALADDLVEPFRPLVDGLVLSLLGRASRHSIRRSSAASPSSSRSTCGSARKCRPCPSRRSVSPSPWRAASRQAHPIWCCLFRPPMPDGRH